MPTGPTNPTDPTGPSKPPLPADPPDDDPPDNDPPVTISDSGDYVLGGHSYDRATIRWAAESDDWAKLSGPLRDDLAAQAAAIEWAG
jgi:hypothetical protein